jgi:hypothetical protein
MARPTIVGWVLPALLLTTARAVAQEEAPVAGECVIIGVVKDAQGEAIIEGTVSLIGRKESAVTDVEGRYRFELAPGTYQLRFFYELHKPKQVRGVRCMAGQVVAVDEQLEAQQGAVETVEVVTKAETSSTEGQLLTRKRAAAVGDSIGRAEIAKSTDRNAAEAAKRVVGANIVGNRFVYVRGLGERYTNALLDGAPLPSPEPDRQTVPLDLFPSQMLDGLTIAKTFTPDMPADFAGGSVRIAMRRLPSTFSFSASLGLGLNTQSTFRQGLSYRGSSTDFLGIDSGTRALPSGTPDYKLVRGGSKADGTFVTSEELTQHGREINAFMSTRRRLTAPDHSGGVVIGNTFNLGGEQKLGVMAALNYRRGFEERRDEVLRTFGIDGQKKLVLQNDLRVDRGIDKVRWGGLAGVTYEINPRQRLHLTGLYSRSSDNEATELEGYHEERGAIVHETRLGFVSRALAFGQLRGEHEMSALGGAKIDWNLSLGRATRDEPDTRSTVFQLDSSFGYAFEDDTSSGSHFFANQGETSIGGGIDWTQPLPTANKDSKLKLGGAFSTRSRGFGARRFRFKPTPKADPKKLLCTTTTWDASCPDQLFPEENIGTVFELDETTRANDAYDAGLQVFAGYAMADLALSKRVRFIAGQRLEASRQTISAFDPHAPQAAPVEAKLKSQDLLPALALVWSPTGKTNLRAAVTRTLARPQLRELAPFSFTDFFGGRESQGNPDLRLTHITNGDLRFELFPTTREVFAASVFVKHFEAPIEEVIQAAGARGITTYENAKSALLTGLELEGRKSLGFIHQRIADLSIIANFTVTHSRVSLEEATAAFVTNRDRPLSNQAPFIVNLALDYSNDTIGTSARILYNVAGKRLVQVGTAGIPDVYEQPRHQLDLAVSQRVSKAFTLEATGTNLINDSVRRTQGKSDDEESLVHRYTTGVSFGISASYTH